MFKNFYLTPIKVWDSFSHYNCNEKMPKHNCSIFYCLSKGRLLYSNELLLLQITNRTVKYKCYIKISLEKRIEVKKWTESSSDRKYYPQPSETTLLNYFYWVSHGMLVKSIQLFSLNVHVQYDQNHPCQLICHD